MKHNARLLKADIQDELSKIARLEKEFANIKGKLDLEPEKLSFYDRGAIGYLLHNFYNGCENIFKLIARFFENDVSRDTWHKDLLKRMKLEIEGYRPKVIDDTLFALLDDFRGFRHFFRHAYTFELDWEKERIVAKKLPKTAALFHAQIMDFLNHIDQVDI
jgi:hypothetical protein